MGSVIVHYAEQPDRRYLLFIDAAVRLSGNRDMIGLELEPPIPREIDGETLVSIL